MTDSRYYALLAFLCGILGKLDSMQGSDSMSLLWIAITAVYFVASVISYMHE